MKDGFSRPLVGVNTLFLAEGEKRDYSPASNAAGYPASIILAKFW